MKIGIIGFGFVGKSIFEFFNNLLDVKVYDIKKNDITVDSIKELTDNRIIFICLPTPMKKTGECDTSIIESVISELNDLSFKSKSKVIIKSTIPPGTTESFIKKYTNLEIGFNPEFLTEANSIEDFKNQDRIIIGTHKKEYFQEIKTLYRIGFHNTQIIHSTPIEAEMVKYVSNIYLATKVSFANEIYSICNFLDIDYNTVINIAKIDKRLGESHWQVPGPDGKRGFGGSCFPKDINALIYFCKDKNIDIDTIVSAWHTNLRVRPEEDWKLLKGRAVSESE